MEAVDPISGQLILVNGPSRGGKSRWAEHLLSQSSIVTYIATSACRPDDMDWQKRLLLHRQRRPEHWMLLECEANLSAALAEIDPNSDLLIDSLGGFVAWHLEAADEEWDVLVNALLDDLSNLKRLCVVVIEETGWGVVPPTAVGGLFRDRLGALAQLLDAKAARSWLVLQGRAIDLHAVSRPVP